MPFSPILAHASIPISACAIVMLHAAMLRFFSRDPQWTFWTNGTFWFVAAAGAFVLCIHAARLQASRYRQAWWLLGAGCGSWALGQALWTYRHYVAPNAYSYPSLPDFLYFGFVPLAIAGLLRLPRPQSHAAFSVKLFCNLALLLNALLTVLFIALWEPARRSTVSQSVIWVHGAYCLSIGSVLIVALYLFWSYKWQSTWWPLLLVTTAAVVYTAGDIYYLRAVITNTYAATDWVNMMWDATFALIAVGAYEQRWRVVHPPVKAGSRSLARDRWLEATIPGLLILAIVGVACLNTRWLSAPVLAVCAASTIVFALLLSIREIYIQREEERLLTALNASHADLVAANEGLASNELRIRALNAQLENRVSERTAELNSAYRELEGFSYAVAHDIKAPLRAMNGFGALLAQEYAERLDSKGLGYIDRIRRGATHLGQLVDDLLAYTRIERQAIQRQPTNIDTLLTDCIAEQCEDIERLSVQIDSRIAALQLNIDVPAIRQAIRNILQNAIKFSRNAKPPRIVIAAERKDKTALLSIGDNGIGFDMKYHEQIFSLFQRLHRVDEYPGTGIGLAIARKAVERMGGRIWAESVPNAGATFFIELPL